MAVVVVIYVQTKCKWYAAELPLSLMLLESDFEFVANNLCSLCTKL